MREKCLKCFRPKISCLCSYLTNYKTKTQFIFLMHPMEFKKVKNGTGRLTYLQLENSKLFVGVNFTHHKEVNEIINDPENNCFVLYPGEDSVVVNSKNKNKFCDHKKNTIFIIDGTWPCAKKMMKLSSNINQLTYISFNANKTSQFEIKQQPHYLCLSTIESVGQLLSCLDQQGIENLNFAPKTFLKPFEELIRFQKKCINQTDNKRYRSSAEGVLKKKTMYRAHAQRALFYDPRNF